LLVEVETLLLVVGKLEFNIAILSTVGGVLELDAGILSLNVALLALT